LLSIYDQFLQVPLHLIDADDDKNVRKTSGLAPAQIHQFAERLQQNGQVVPLALRQNSQDRFNLICGYRRYKAASFLGWESMWGGVLRDDITDEQAASIHLIENIDRKELTSYEMAFGAALFLENGNTNLSDYAQKIGASPKTLTQTITWLNTLPKNILADWATNHPLLDYTALTHLAKLPPSESEAKWDDWKLRSETGLSREVSDIINLKRRRVNPNKRPRLIKLITLHEKCSQSDLDPSTKKIVLQVIEYAQGARRAAPQFPKTKARKAG